MEEVLPNLFRIEIPLPRSPLKALNSYAIKAEDRNLIIDTGLNRKECLEAMQAAWRELDLDSKKTDFFITHIHADHYGLVSRLVTDTSTIYFNRPDAEIMKEHEHWEPVVSYAALNGFPEDELRSAISNHPGYKYGSESLPELTLLEDGDTLKIGDYVFKCVQTPGHTRGHICLHERAKKILVAGDHILNDITPNIQCWSNEGNPLKNYLASLDKVYDLEVDLVLPGHRRLFTNYKERIDELKTHHQNRLDEILVILKEGSMNAFQIASHMTWDITYKSWDLFPVTQKWFATGEAIAHLRLLEEKGTVLKEMKEETIIFSLNHG